MNPDTPNPTAFPCQDIIERNAKGQLVGHEISGAGMTLRDYFAAKAMQALLHEANSTDGSWCVEANASYEIADAMLKARTA